MLWATKTTLSVNSAMGVIMMVGIVVSNGVLLVDYKDGMILDVNPYLIEMLGYTKVEFLGKHLWEVGVFKDIAASKDNFLELRRTQQKVPRAFQPICSVTALSPGLSALPPPLPWRPRLQ